MNKTFINKLIEDALLQNDPAEALRELAVKLNNNGLNNKAVFDAFNSFYELLQENNKQQETDILGDVMDMITGWYVGRELKLK